MKKAHDWVEELQEAARDKNSTVARVVEDIQADARAEARAQALADMIRYAQALLAALAEVES